MVGVAVFVRQARPRKAIAEAGATWHGRARPYLAYALCQGQSVPKEPLGRCQAVFFFEKLPFASIQWALAAMEFEVRQAL